MALFCKRAYILMCILMNFCFISEVYATNNPKIIANRGGKGEFPENTIYAIKTVLEAGVDGVEIDLQLTKDKVVLY